MNKVEFWLMNNPIRGFIQGFEARKLKSMSDLPKGKTVLEIGCGQGRGTELIRRYFEPAKLYAIDLDENMIARAKRRVDDDNVSFSVADVAHLPFVEGSFDAVFDFGILHHIPNWREALREINRVLKPGGSFILEDLSRETFSSLPGKGLKLFLDHPYQEMFGREDFYQALQGLGFRTEKKYENSYWFGRILKKN